MPLRLVIVLFASYLVAFIDRGLISVAAAPIRQDLRLSDTQLGLLIGPAFVAFYCLCAIPLGWLADRTSRRGLLCTAMLFWSLMMACCALAHSFGSLAAARLGVGLGEACLVPVGVSLIAAETADQHVGKALGIFLMGATVGNATALLVGGHILLLVPWRVLFLVASLAGLPMAAAVMTLSEPARGTRTMSLGASLQQVLAQLQRRTSAYGYLSVATACVIVLAQVPIAWMPLYWVRTFGLSPGTSAVLLGLIVLVTAPAGQGAGSFLIDRLRTLGFTASPHVVQAGSALAALPTAVVFCTSRCFGCAVWAFALYNFLVFAATPAGMTGWRLLTPQSGMGLTVSVLTAAVTLFAIGLGPPVVGAVSDLAFRTDNSLGLALGVVIVAATALGVSSALLGRLSFTQAIDRANVGQVAVVTGELP
jgi:MFS family permease